MIEDSDEGTVGTTHMLAFCSRSTNEDQKNLSFSTHIQHVKTKKVRIFLSSHHAQLFLFLLSSLQCHAEVADFDWPMCAVDCNNTCSTQSCGKRLLVSQIKKPSFRCQYEKKSCSPRWNMVKLENSDGQNTFQTEEKANMEQIKKKTFQGSESFFLSLLKQTILLFFQLEVTSS